MTLLGLPKKLRKLRMKLTRHSKVELVVKIMVICQEQKTVTKYLIGQDDWANCEKPWRKTLMKIMVKTWTYIKARQKLSKVSLLG